MATSDPLTILLAQDRWATSNVLEACQGLSEAQFHQRFDMGPGSLHDTTTHILGAMRGWTDMLAGRPLRTRLEQGGRRTALELAGLHGPIADEFAAEARDLDEIAAGERGGRTYRFKRGAIFTHVLTHGMHHRAQCLNMLRLLGGENLPSVSVVEWMMMVDGQG